MSGEEVSPILECDKCPAYWDLGKPGLRGIIYTVPFHIRIQKDVPNMLCSGSGHKKELTYYEIGPNDMSIGL